jgi:hypothetical protein
VPDMSAISLRSFRSARSAALLAGSAATEDYK